MSRTLLLVTLLLARSVVLAADAPEPEGVAGAAEAQPTTEGDATPVPGMSILGNQEAPKALVIVPWKSSAIGDSLRISTMLDDSRQPVDREVFLRTLSYFEIRSTTTRHDGAPAGGPDAADRR